MRKLREKTELQIQILRAKWIDHDDKYKCNIYAIELDLEKKSE